jgi:arsenite methyltransferase
MSETVTTNIKDYYGKVLSDSDDLKTTACCNPTDLPKWQKDILSSINDEVLAKFYGCGSPIPPSIKGKTILDLGSGSGRDVYMLSKLAGENGSVIGIDMTDEQLEVARKVEAEQMQIFGYKKSNVKFVKGYMEKLDDAGIADNTVDVVTSNCVLNLSTDKKKVFEEIFRVLKKGGELYFSDVFSDRRIPPEHFEDEVLAGECLAGALYIEDFRRIMREMGCLDYRVIESSKIEITNDKINEKLGMINFYSITIRAFKLDSLEDICEDYGQVATYKGSIEHHDHKFELDDHHTFFTGKPLLVCGNTTAMLEETRFAEHFEITGDRKVHYGVFDCGPDDLQNNTDSSAGACC